MGEDKEWVAVERAVRAGLDDADVLTDPPKTERKSAGSQRRSRIMLWRHLRPSRVRKPAEPARRLSPAPLTGPVHSCRSAYRDSCVAAASE